MAPTPFNLNIYVVAEQWLDRVELVDGVRKAACVAIKAY